MIVFDWVRRGSSSGFLQLWLTVLIKYIHAPSLLFHQSVLVVFYVFVMVLGYG